MSFNKFAPSLATLSIVAAATMLTACGGGGGGGGGSETQSPTTPAQPIVTAPTIVTDVPVATYASSSQEALIFNTINEQRNRCGFGKLAQNINIDKAALAHAKYIEQNALMTHFEVATYAGFTGVSPTDRAHAAGYAGSTGEVLTSNYYSGYSIPKNIGLDGLQTLLAAPYHELGLVSGYRDIGIGLSVNTINQNGLNVAHSTLVMNPGITSNIDFQTNTEIRSFPCEGTTNVLHETGGETPNPFPNEASPLWGQPIIVMGSADLQIKSASITGPSGSIQVKAIYGNGQSKDPNNFFTTNSVIIPSVLTANTTYTVTFTATNKGATSTKTFSFKTM